MIEEIEKLISTTLIDSKYLTITVVDILNILFIILISRLIVFLIKRLFDRRVKQKHIAPGKAYAITQIIKYFIYSLAVVVALDVVGVNITVLIASSTALFVGIGLGLQDVFKDFASGLVILSERTIKAHDIVDIDGTIGEIIEIGLRTSKLKLRDDSELILPNHRLTNLKVINWSNIKRDTRFAVEVGVAYGSDTQLVKKLLIDVARNNGNVTKNTVVEVLFTNFGTSSLDFKLLFYSRQLFRIERVKSELRFEIDKAFRENNITIAFPQMDVWFKNNLPNTEKN